MYQQKRDRIYTKLALYKWVNFCSYLMDMTGLFAFFFYNATSFTRPTTKLPIIHVTPREIIVVSNGDSCYRAGWIRIKK